MRVECAGGQGPSAGGSGYRTVGFCHAHVLANVMHLWQRSAALIFITLWLSVSTVTRGGGGEGGITVLLLKKGARQMFDGGKGGGAPTGLCVAAVYCMRRSSPVAAAASWQGWWAGRLARPCG
jgi:hypothetical protein